MGYLHFENLNCLEEIWLQQLILNYLYLKKEEKRKKNILFLSLFSDLVNFKSKGFNYVWSKTLFMFNFKMEYEFYLHKYLMQFVITCICD